MTRTPSGRPDPAALVVLALALALVAPAAGRAQGIHVAMLPDQQTMTPGATFDLTLDVTAAGAAFNGFDVVVAFDPAALTLVPLVPSTLQQGCLMTGGCSAACGTTFHLFDAAADSAAVTDVLLCDQIMLQGPGHLYALRFQASTTPQITQVTVRRARFYAAGIDVTPVTTAGCELGIGVSLDAPSPSLGAGALSLRCESNPARGGVWADIVLPSNASARLDLLDVAGRRVAGSEASALGIGPHRVELTRGLALSPGVYLVRLAQGAELRTARVVILD